jgi:hypothetical protein
MSPIGFLDAAQQVLKEAGRPMHVDAIVDEVLRREVCKSQAKNPHESYRKSLESDVSRGPKPNPRGFVKVSPGIYGLIEWGVIQAKPQEVRDLPGPASATAMVAPAKDVLNAAEQTRQPILPVRGSSTSSAFELLHEQLEACLSDEQEQIAQAAHQGAFDRVDQNLRRARELGALRTDLENIEKRFGQLVEVGSEE